MAEVEEAATHEANLTQDVADLHPPDPPLAHGHNTEWERWRQHSRFPNSQLWDLKALVNIGPSTAQQEAEAAQVSSQYT